MKLTSKLWNLALPVTSALSFFTCNRIFSKRHKNQHPSSPSPLPPPTLYTPHSFPEISSTLSEPPISSPTSQAAGPPHLILSPPSKNLSSPAIRFPARSYPIAFNVDILFLVLSLLNDTMLSRCNQVCKLWHEISMSLLWRDALRNGLQPLLRYVDTYYDDETVDPVYKKRQAKLTEPPSPTSWSTKFETRAGPYICSLTLDLKSLMASQYLIDSLVNSSATRIHLPHLWKLNIIVNQDVMEFELALRFMQPTVRHLTLDIWEPLPHKDRGTYAMRRELEAHIPRFKNSGQSLSPPFPLPGFFALIAIMMPGLTHLAFTMRDESEMLKAWPSFVDLCLVLEKLQVLQLPLYALTPAAIPQLASHPSLQRLATYDRTKHRIAPSEPYCDVAFVPQNTNTSSERGPLAHLTDLALTAAPMEVFPFFQIHEPLNLTVVHVNFSAYFPVVADVNAFFVAIANSFPALQDLKLCPVMCAGGITLRPTYVMLRPLTRCRELVSLEIVTTHLSRFSNEEFADLVSHWKRLQCLVLDHLNAVCVDPSEQAELSLDAAVQALREHCSGIRLFLLYVSPILDSLHGLIANAGKLSSLHEIELFIGIPLAAKPEQVANYLGSILPQTCALNLHPTTCNIFEVLEPERTQRAWERRRRDLSRFIRSVMLARRS